MVIKDVTFGTSWAFDISRGGTTINGTVATNPLTFKE